MGVLRISMGWIFLWAFADKTFGLGFATTAEKAWINGASPTTGFLQFGAQGPFAETFQAMAGSGLVDWLFMLGLLGVGIGMTFGIMMRVAAWSGTAMMLLMWLALLTPENNPFMDDHIIYALVMLYLAYAGAGKVYGLGNWWSKQSFVKNTPFLQ